MWGRLRAASAFSRPETRVSAAVRTYVYVDGFNLYYGSVKGTPYGHVPSSGVRG